MLKIALVGNPNSGKTTMFNALTGAMAYVGNWPGVTVEKKEGRMKSGGGVLCDLPGIYSLSPYTPEEIVTRDYLLSERPAAIINLVDASNLERNLYLTLQLLETGIPVVIALNMIDMVRKSGDMIDIEKLSAFLGCEVVPTSALRGEGLKEVAARAIAVAHNAETASGSEQLRSGKHCVFRTDTEKALSALSQYVSAAPQRFYAVKLFERDGEAMKGLRLTEAERAAVDALVSAQEADKGDIGEAIIANERYEYIENIVSKCMKKKNPLYTASDRIDRIVTSRVLALPIFATVMFAVYYLAISSVGGWSVELMEGAFEVLGGIAAEWLASASAPEWIGSLLVDAVIGGVGAVLVYVPQMFVLFLMLAILEDIGYMARVAFIMDKLFRRFGLSGKSFIPILIASGCGVPAIMASRTIENEKDRRMTAIVATFIPCGAKLPIIALIAGGLFGGAWWMAPVMYFAGIFAVVFSGILLKKTRLFSGKVSPFVMELPQYHIPDTRTVLAHAYDRAKSFVVKAGTIILIGCTMVWFLQSFGIEDGGLVMVEAESSLLAVFGGAIAPIFAPLGFGYWQAAVASLTGIVAKEQVVGTLGTLLASSGGADIGALMSQWGGVAFLIFNLICAPCFAAIGALRRELGGKWCAFAVVYQTALAYFLAFAFYQVATAASRIFG